MDFEHFEKKFEKMRLEVKIQLYNEWVSRCAADENFISTLDEQFFKNNFQSYMQLAEKIGLAGIDMGNRFVRLDSWGDIQTLSDDDADEIVSDALRQIYSHQEIWKNYI